MPGLAAFQGGAPTVNGRGICLDHRFHNDICREICQHATDNDCLNDVITVKGYEDICHVGSIPLREDVSNSMKNSELLTRSDNS